MLPEISLKKEELENSDSGSGLPGLPEFLTLHISNQIRSRRRSEPPRHWRTAVGVAGALLAGLQSKAGLQSRSDDGGGGRRAVAQWALLVAAGGGAMAGGRRRLGAALWPCGVGGGRWVSGSGHLVLAGGVVHGCACVP